MAIDLNFLCLLVDQNGWLSLFFSHLAFSSLSSLWSHPSHNSICWIMCSHIILSLFQRIFTALSPWHLIIQSWGEARRNWWIFQFSQATSSVGLFCVPMCCPSLYGRCFCCLVTAPLPSSTTVRSPPRRDQISLTSFLSSKLCKVLDIQYSINIHLKYDTRLTNRVIRSPRRAQGTMCYIHCLKHVKERTWESTCSVQLEEQTVYKKRRIGFWL